MFYQLRRIGKIRSFLSTDAANKLAVSLTLSRIDYRNSVLAGISDNKLNKLQRIQNHAAQLILRKSKRASASGLLRTYLLTYAHRSRWSIGHQRPHAIALCSGLLLSFRTSWSPAVLALLQCLASNCCEAGLSSSSPAGSRSGLGVWCWMLAS